MGVRTHGWTIKTHRTNVVTQTAYVGGKDIRFSPFRNPYTCISYVSICLSVPASPAATVGPRTLIYISYDCDSERTHVTASIIIVTARQSVLNNFQLLRLRSNIAVFFQEYY